MVIQSDAETVGKGREEIKIFCPYCGNEMPVKGKFCIHCGESLEVLWGEFGDSENTADEENVYADIGRDEGRHILNVNPEHIMEKTDPEDGAKQDDGVQALDIIEYCVVVNNDFLDIKLLDQQKIDHFKEDYFSSGKFVFPLGEYKVCYTGEIVCYINAQVYFKYVATEIENYCCRAFNEQIYGWESLFETVFSLYRECIGRIASMTVKMMVASGIMSYTENTIREMFGDTSFVKEKLLAYAEEYDAIMKEYATAENIREMNQMLSENSSYTAGGFGFRGVLGGMVAAGLANAGSHVVSSVKNSIERSSNKAKLQKDLDTLAGNIDILDAFKSEIILRTGEALVIYIKACNEELHVGYGPYDDEGAVNMGRNTISYMDDPQIILKNLSGALTLAPMLKDEAIDFLIDNFYGNKEVTGQILVLADFYLQGRRTRHYLKKVQRKALKGIWDMPEKTAADVGQKIEKLKEESDKIGYDARKDMNRLNAALEQKKKQEKEAGLNRAMQLPECTSLEIEGKIAGVKEEAGKIGYDVTEEIRRLSTVLEQKKKQEKEADLNRAMQLPERTLLEIEVKTARIREEADKIGYDVEEKIAQMEQKRLRLEKEEREADYCKALELPEDSIELLSEKMISVKRQADRNNIDCGDVLQDLQNKIEEKEREKIQEKLDKKKFGILYEAFIILADMIEENNLKDYLHGIFPKDEESFFEDNEKFGSFTHLYDLKDGEFPILCYDDTLLKSARDGFILTNRGLLNLKITYTYSLLIHCLQIPRRNQTIKKRSFCL